MKNFTPAQVLFADAFYTLANTFWQLPITSIIDKIGKKNCLIIGNILYSLSILAMIFMQNYYELLIIQFIYALGYSMKGLCEPNILYDSLPRRKKRGKLFSKIDGKSASYFYLFDAISSVIAGFTFVINGYIPMVLCFICCVISTIISFIAIGFIGTDPLSKSSLILIFVFYLIQYAIKGPYQALIARYLNNFTNRKIRPKITALKHLTANLFTAIISMLCAIMLNFTTTANTFIVVGCITTLLLVLLLDYMRDKVGLKPEQYSQEDLKYSLNRPEIK